MRTRLLSALFIFGIMGWAYADIAVTPGTGKTVATTTDATREFQNVIISTSYVNNGSGVPVVVGYQTGGSSVPVSVIGGSLISNQGTAGTSKWGVDLSTGVQVNTKGGPNLGVDFSTGVQVNTGSRFLSVDFSTGVSINTKGQPNLGIDLSTGVQVNTGAKYLAVDYSTGVAVQMRVSSTTLPSAVSDGSFIYPITNNIGQQGVMGVPWGIIQTTYSVTISSAQTGAGNTTGETPLVSSAATNTYTYLCDCNFVDLGGTSGAVIIESPAGTTTNRYSVGVSTGVINVNVGQGCMDPFFRSPPATNVYIFQTAATARQNITQRCRYYQGP